MKSARVMAVFALFLLASCAPNKGQMGAAGGAAAGALAGQAIGHDTQSTLIGAALGGLTGYIIGNELDKYDQQQLNRVYESARSGETTTWTNPDNGNRIQATPEAAYAGPNNQNCRKAEVMVSKSGGESKKDYVTACRDTNGNWQIQ